MPPFSASCCASRICESLSLLPIGMENNPRATSRPSSSNLTESGCAQMGTTRRSRLPRRAARQAPLPRHRSSGCGVDRSMVSCPTISATASSSGKLPTSFTSSNAITLSAQGVQPLPADWHERCNHMSVMLFCYMHSSSTDTSDCTRNELISPALVECRFQSPGRRSAIREAMQPRRYRQAFRECAPDPQACTPRIRHKRDSPSRRRARPPSGCLHLLQAQHLTERSRPRIAGNSSGIISRKSPLRNFQSIGLMLTAIVFTSTSPLPAQAWVHLHTRAG